MERLGTDAPKEIPIVTLSSVSRKFSTSNFFMSEAIPEQWLNAVCQITEKYWAGYE
jgi:hypothetical protein